MSQQATVNFLSLLFSQSSALPPFSLPSIFTYLPVPVPLEPPADAVASTSTLGPLCPLLGYRMEFRRRGGREGGRDEQLDSINLPPSLPPSLPPHVPRPMSLLSLNCTLTNWGLSDRWMACVLAVRRGTSGTVTTSGSAAAWRASDYKRGGRKREGGREGGIECESHGRGRGMSGTVAARRASD